MILCWQSDQVYSAILRYATRSNIIVPEVKNCNNFVREQIWDFFFLYFWATSLCEKGNLHLLAKVQSGIWRYNTIYPISLSFECFSLLKSWTLVPIFHTFLWQHKTLTSSSWNLSLYTDLWYFCLISSCILVLE